MTKNSFEWNDFECSIVEQINESLFFSKTSVVIHYILHYANFFLCNVMFAGRKTRWPNIFTQFVPQRFAQGVHLDTSQSLTSNHNLSYLTWLIKFVLWPSWHLHAYLSSRWNHVIRSNTQLPCRIERAPAWFYNLLENDHYTDTKNASNSPNRFPIGCDISPDMASPPPNTTICFRSQANDGSA